MGTAVRALGFSLSMLLLFVSPRTAVSSDTLEELQRRFDGETDGVSKAKLLNHLGDLQFDREREASKAGDYQTADFIMEKYRDNVRAALDALKKSHPDAERHPAGYKQLEIHLEAGIREVTDLMATVPEEYRPPLQLVKKDLIAFDREMLHLLFPRRPGEKAQSPKPPADAAPPPQEKQS